jgi:putative acetyltransferase
MPDIIRIELAVKDSHMNAIKLYEKMGFIAEGRFEKKFKNADGSYDADIPMVWMNSQDIDK